MADSIKSVRWESDQRQDGSYTYAYWHLIFSVNSSTLCKRHNLEFRAAVKFLSEEESLSKEFTVIKVQLKNVQLYSNVLSCTLPDPCLFRSCRIFNSFGVIVVRLACWCNQKGNEFFCGAHRWPFTVIVLALIFGFQRYQQERTKNNVNAQDQDFSPAGIFLAFIMATQREILALTLTFSDWRWCQTGFSIGTKIQTYYEFVQSLCHGSQVCSIWAATRENLSSGIWEQHRRRPACASAQSDQRLCYLLFAKNHISTCCKRNFNFLPSLCSWADWFVSRFVGYPEDRLCRDEAHMYLVNSSIVIKKFAFPFFVQNGKNQLLHQVCKWTLIDRTSNRFI